MSLHRPCEKRGDGQRRDHRHANPAGARAWPESSVFTPISWRPLLVAVIGLALLASPAQASFLSGETLDTAANILSWLALIIAPTVAIAVFWLVHILPEKIAEKRRHPQAKAIQALCLLSLAFGGLLWPLAWIWAYSKPVLYKLAYGTDVAPEHEHDGKPSPSHANAPSNVERIRQLRHQLDALDPSLVASPDLQAARRAILSAEMSLSSGRTGDAQERKA